MIQITVDTKENKIKISCEMNAKGQIAVEEFKVLNREFYNIRSDLLKKFPLYVQAELLSDMLEI